VSRALTEVGSEHLGVLADLVRSSVGESSRRSRARGSSQTLITTCMLCSTRTTVQIETFAQPAYLFFSAFGYAIVHPGGRLIE